MGSPHRPATGSQRDWEWSRGEKIVAHRAFDLALNRELENVIRETKKRTEQITEASELWVLEQWLGACRRSIDETFNFRYSALLLVFAILLRRGLLSEDNLRGLSDEKLDAIRHVARM